MSLGKTINGTELVDGELTLEFTDGSTWTFRWRDA